ncbi:MAG: MerR family transcriptional regulator [Blautia sp.]|nr:MerR family transcriptional regulator [Blautia sp.]MDY3997626.1 MerR family transcriptional regulator [Blautia sp.]
MLKIGEFSKLSYLTVKALRFYEKEKLLVPALIDEWTGYRFYETSQLVAAAKIKAYRQLGLSIDEIKAICSGTDVRKILSEKAKALSAQREEIDVRLSIINHILEDDKMKYQITEKIIPAAIVYYSETILENYQDIMQWIPSLGEELKRLNPHMKCAEPAYEFCEYPDNTRIKIFRSDTMKRLRPEE